MSQTGWIVEARSVRLALLGLWVVVSRVRDRGVMNQYAVMLQEHWRSARPGAFAELEDPVGFFTRAGEEIAVAIAELTPGLAGLDLPGEDTLAKAARLANARASAIEMVLTDSGLWGPGELSREEWEGSTQDHVDALIEWAWRMQDQLAGEEQFGLSFEDASTRFLLPVSFLEQLVAAGSPRMFLSLPESWAVWEASVELRWMRDRAAV